MTVPEDDDRWFTQDDDEMPGEDFADMLKRLGLTQEEYFGELPPAKK